MPDMRCFQRALETASRALGSGDRTTAKAYITIAHRELLAAINATRGLERERADAAFVYIIDHCRAALKPGEEIWILGTFWEGFEHGLDDWTWHDGADPVYEAGYDFGQHGARRSYETGNDTDFDFTLEGDDTG